MNLNNMANFWQCPPSDQKLADSCEHLYWFPQFLNDGSYKSEYNIEWKKYLLNKNSFEIKKYHKSKRRFVFYTPKIVKCIFNLCKIFRQPPEVRYLAVDILDRLLIVIWCKCHLLFQIISVTAICYLMEMFNMRRGLGFLVEHFHEVRETYEKMKKDRNDTWEAIVERMLNQSPLRILTSVQLAMKYSWSSNIITVTDFKQIMEFLASNEQYSRRSIIKSEARVYKQLDYNITNGTPFTYLEMFFDDIRTHQLFNLGVPLHDFFATCIHVLDIATIFHNRIYKTLQETARNAFDNDPAASDSAAAIKANFALLAASVIFASFCLMDPGPAPFRVRLDILCSMGECKKSDIEELSKQILNVVSALSNRSHDIY